MRKFVLLPALILSLSLLAAPVASLRADPATSTKSAARGLTADEFSAQSNRILRRRVPVYRRALGPNAVRVCNAYYVQEFRPSGTVITPRMKCYWRG